MMNNELANHVAHLLLENDCVIVPSLGGFVAHYVPAKFDEKEGVLCLLLVKLPLMCS